MDEASASPIPFRVEALGEQPRALAQPLDTFTVSLQRRRRTSLGVALDRDLRTVPEHLGSIEGCLGRIPRRRAAQAFPEPVGAMRLTKPLRGSPEDDLAQAADAVNKRRSRPPPGCTRNPLMVLPKSRD